MFEAHVRLESIRYIDSQQLPSTRPWTDQRRGWWPTELTHCCSVCSPCMVVPRSKALGRLGCYR